jgi:hypothetical protein
MEKEFTDPAPYYYSGGGQFYSPQLVRSLSETGQTSSSGPGGGPSGGSIAGPSGSSGPGFNPASVPNIETSAENEGGGAAAGFLAGFLLGAEAGGLGYGPVGALIGGAIGAIASFFEEIFGGGGSSPEIPRQLRHGRHPLYPDILGVLFGLIPTEASAMLVFSASGAPPPNVAPLQKPGYMTVQYPEYNYCGPGNNGGTTTPDTTDNCCKQHDDCYALHGLTAENMHRPGQGASAAQQACDQQLCTCVSGLPGASGPYDALMQFGIRKYFRCQ